MYMTLTRKLTCLLILILLCGTGCRKAFSVQVPEEVREDDGLWQYARTEEMPAYQVSGIPQGDFSVSFWIRPEENTVSTCLFHFGDEQEFVKLYGRGINGDVFSGLTLYGRTGGAEYWVVADGVDSVSTNRWNLVTVNFRKNTASILLNGKIVAEDSFKHLSGDSTLVIGGDSAENTLPGRYIDLKIIDSLVSAEDAAKEYASRLPAVLLDTIDYPDADQLSRDLWFEDMVIDGLPVTWTVEENPVMNSQGLLKDTDTETEIHAKAKIDNGTYSAEKDFVFHTTGSSEEALFRKDMQSLNIDIPAVIHSHTTLPEKEQDTFVEYEVVSGDAHFEGNVLVKDSTAEKEPVTFKAVLNRKGSVQEKYYNVMVLDDAYGYVMAYFNGNEGEERGHLALSMDGLHWDKLPGSVISSDYGTGRIRDPHLSRSKEGDFLIAATEGGDHPYIYLFHSEDLTKYTSAYPLVCYPDRSLHTSGTKAWAPEIWYDRESDTYYLYYSDPSESTGTISCVTADLSELPQGNVQVSYPETLLDTGYPVIDGTIFTMDGKYWMIYKDEREGAQTIYSAETDDLSKTFRICYDWQYMILPRPVEGPMVFKDIHEEKYHLFVDYFAYHRFFAGTFTGLGYDSLVDWSDSDTLALPEEDVRHGSILPVTEKEYHRLLDAYH